MSNEDINASNKAQLAAQEQAKNTNDLNAKQAGLFLAATKELAKLPTESAKLSQGFADAIDKAKADPTVWNTFTPEERDKLLVDREDFLKQAVTFREQAVTINAQVAQTQAELSQMTFNGEKIDTNIQLTEESLRENAGVPADFTVASASTIDDPASEADPLVPPPLGPVNSNATTTLLTDDQINAIYPPTDPKEVDARFQSTIISDEARAALSDPAAIAEQQALNEAAAANPLRSAESVSTEVSDAEAAALFAETQPVVVNPEPQFPPDDTAVDREETVFDPANVEPNSDPFEQARYEAELALAEQEAREFEPTDVPVMTDEEADALDAQQAENRRVLALQATDVEPGLFTGQTDEFGGVDEAIKLQAKQVSNDDPATERYGAAAVDAANANPAFGFNPDSEVIAAEVNARQQAELQRQRQQAAQADWRVKLSLAPQSNYLYNDPALQKDGILYPLSITSGVIFPYMPTISTSYSANYNNYDLTHSNYRGHFYQNSYVNEVSIGATFTAQDTFEANYLLAVIHFFRSVTKMFYGQDAVNRGAPPPLVFLTGLGEYQFSKHPCVVTNFDYSLPNDVDYVRARVTPINGTNLLSKRDRQTVPTNPISSAMSRLSQIGQKKGGINIPPPPPTLGQLSPTYVPTRLEMSLTLLPMQTREQVSKQFSLQKFANGNLLKGGFW